MRNLLRDRGSDFRTGGGIGFARFGHDDKFLGTGAFVLETECDDAALANSFGATGELLDFVRIEIAAAFDDDVLDAAGDVNFAVGPIGAIA